MYGMYYYYTLFAVKLQKKPYSGRSDSGQIVGSVIDIYGGLNSEYEVEGKYKGGKGSK